MTPFVAGRRGTWYRRMVAVRYPRAEGETVSVSLEDWRDSRTSLSFQR